jgi:hypothetical protein
MYYVSDIRRLPIYYSKPPKMPVRLVTTVAPALEFMEERVSKFRNPWAHAIRAIRRVCWDPLQHVRMKKHGVCLYTRALSLKLEQAPSTRDSVSDLHSSWEYVLMGGRGVKRVQEGACLLWLTVHVAAEILNALGTIGENLFHS